MPKKLPNGKYFKESWVKWTTFISNIITTNRNKTAIAPTQIMIKINEIYSHSNKSKIVDEETKLKTKNKTEYIEFRLKTVIKELATSIQEKK